MSILSRWLRRTRTAGVSEPVPAPVAEDSAGFHIEKANAAVVHARLVYGRWLVGERELTSEEAHTLATNAAKAAEHLRSFAALLPGEVAADAELAELHPDDLGGAL